MNKIQLIKIALLIVILAEEIRSARKRIVKVSTSIGEKQLTKIVNDENAKNTRFKLRNFVHPKIDNTKSKSLMDIANHDLKDI